MTASTANLENQPKSKKQRTIILTTLGCVLSVAMGVGLGYILSEVYPYITKSEDYSGLDPLKLKADGKACFEKYSKNPKNAFTGGMENWELVNAALYKFEQTENSMTQGIGAAYAKIGPTSVEQLIRSTTYRVGSSYFEESLSKSFAVNVAWRMYEGRGPDGTDTAGKTLRYKGSCPQNVETPQFASDVTPTTYDEAQYLEHAGRNLDGSSFIYLVSAKTLAKEGAEKTSGEPLNQLSKDKDGNYVIDLELDRRKGVINYVKQMKATTDLNGNPSFDYCHVKFVLTPDLYIVSSTSKERYFASTPSGSSNIEGSLVTTYSYGGDYTIPDLKTPIRYSK